MIVWNLYGHLDKLQEEESS